MNAILRSCRRWVAVIVVLVFPSALLVADEPTSQIPIGPAETVVAEKVPEDVPVDAPIPTAEPKNELKAPVDPLAKQVEEAIEISSHRYLNADLHTPWQIIHGILAYRQGYEIKKSGERINAIKFVSNGPSYRGEQWFEKTQFGGRAHPFSQPYAFEGHPNQFLGYMSMSDLPLDHTFKAGSATITVADILNNAKAEINGNEEITWTLWAFSRYLEPTAQWTNRYGERWSMERLVQIQTQASVYNAACGGTHGLFALSCARNAYIQDGKPLRGAWFEADQKIRQYVETARALQNPDGTFSSNYFRGTGRAYDFETTVSTSGHTLEFLMVALPQDRLREEWVRRGVWALASQLIEHRSQPLECGALYHAVDALNIYRERTQPQPAVAGTGNTETETKEPAKSGASEGRSAAPGETKRPVASTN